MVQVPELLVGVPAPVLYWEQGHEWLFGDPVRFQTVHNYLAQARAGLCVCTCDRAAGLLCC